MGLRKNTDHRSSDHGASEKKMKIILSVPSRDRVGLKSQAPQLPKDKTTLPEQLLDLRILYVSGQLSREEYQSARDEMLPSSKKQTRLKTIYVMAAALFVAAAIVGFII